MPSPKKLPLRILYSLNGSPQYILARSQGPVPIEHIPSQRHGGASSSRSKANATPCYASASLKTCLNTICRSSPEIIQDRTRDFTVYLLDPLESDCAPAQVNISHSLSTQATPDVPETRVAVALGLMSWGLSTDETDTMSVAGTLKASATGHEVLEIIFSLRETIPLEKASLPEALRSWGQPSSSSQRSRGPRKSRARPMKPPPIPLTEADKLLAASAPQSYIGPERRPPGRPSIYKPFRSDNDDVVIVDGPTPSSHNDRRVQDFMALLQAIAPGMERNKALGNVLGLVHGSDGTAVHPPPELADAMVLFSDLQRAQQFRNHSQPEGSHTSSSQHRRKSSSTDDEIVILNKENVNPTVFRRRAEREREEAKLMGSLEPAAPLPSALPFNSASHVQPEASRLTLSDQPLGRKRTLSEFMDEQESAREKEKAQKRYYRQPERAMSEDSIRQAAAVAAATASKRTRTVSTSSGPGVKESATRPPKPSTSASSPARPARKKYIVPAWARTETATQPRLSEVALQQAELKKQEEERKKETRRQQAKEEKAGLKEDRRRKPGPTPTTRSRLSRSTSAPITPPGTKALLLPPVAASSDFPMFVSALPVQSPARAASSDLTPCTPPRKRRANTISTPGGPSSLFTPAPGSCLFTPASGSWEAGGVLSLGRSSMSPSSRKVSTHDKEEPPAADTHDDDDLLGQELDSAFDDFDFPPSSLPIASSDIEVDVETNQMPSSSQDYDSDESEDADAPKQHWVGLPPSSPPPQSSPFMGATPMDDDDVEETPLTTPEADTGSEPEMLGTQVTEYSIEELEKLLDIDDLSSFFAITDTADTTTLFDQFTNHNLPSDDTSPAMTNWGLEGANLNSDFDFTEFWESVRPLVESGSETNQDAELPEMGDLEKDKLASDVHALFSGCLV